MRKRAGLFELSVFIALWEIEWGKVAEKYWREYGESTEPVRKSYGSFCVRKSCKGCKVAHFFVKKYNFFTENLVMSEKSSNFAAIFEICAARERRGDGFKGIKQARNGNIRTRSKHAFFADSKVGEVC